MNFIKYPDKSEWEKILARPTMDSADLEGKVLPVLEAVKKNGDNALRKFTSEFDGVNIDKLLVSPEEFNTAEKAVKATLKDAINIARENIEKFHLMQREDIRKVETLPGVFCWRKSVALTRVGLYIPGGTAPLFSTVLMLGVPANIAGCEEIILCTPPDKSGAVNPAVLYTASLLGISRVFKVGGAQAIAAMAYGTESIPKVYKIFGPGNQYVTAAKQLVSREGVAIDMPAGPSEVAVLADEQANPAFVAADLLSQAEHGPDSQVLLVSDNADFIMAVQQETDKQLAILPRKGIASRALQNSKAILVRNINEGIELLNEYAPEHLIIQTADPYALISQIKNAGSVFLGSYTPEAAGDYASGTNHTLPTNGYAKAYSGVSLDSFVKKITFQSISKEGLLNLGPVIEIMAEEEQLVAHKNAVAVRLKAE